MTVKKSLFIQVQWYGPELEAHLEHIYQEHRNRGKSDYIYNLVLDEIGGTYGLSSKLDTIIPYLPGGPRRACDNVFIGSHYVKWTGTGSAYRQGMLDGGHRWRNLDMQRGLWQQFADKYPFVPAHHYINHEGVLDLFDSGKLRRAYEAYLIQSARDSYEVAPRRAILWAPAIWSRKPLTWAEKYGVKRTFQNVRLHTQGPGVNWLHLQDMQGRKYPPPMWVVNQWYRQLKSINQWDSLRINMELFRTRASGGIEADTPEAVAKRAAYYWRKNIPIGASWEMRWWMENHAEV